MSELKWFRSGDLLMGYGIIGASRSFGILDPSTEDERVSTCFFDGDGNHRLDNIKVEEIK